MKYTILRIEEEDYGCEGVPDNEELMCSVLVRDASGCEKWVKVPDRYLTENSLMPGDTMEESYE